MAQEAAHAQWTGSEAVHACLRSRGAARRASEAGLETAAGGGSCRRPPSWERCIRVIASSGPPLCRGDASGGGECGSGPVPDARPPRWRRDGGLSADVRAV
jgi:hypothetical protein